MQLKKIHKFEGIEKTIQSIEVIVKNSIVTG